MKPDYPNPMSKPSANAMLAVLFVTPSWLDLTVLFMNTKGILNAQNLNNKLADLVTTGTSEHRPAGLSLELLYSALDQVPAFVWITDANGQALFVNQQARQFTGIRDTKNMTSREWMLLISHPDDLEMLLSKWRQAFENQQPLECEYRIKRHDGEYHWMITRSQPIHDAQGKLLGRVGTTVDIQKNKLIEQRDSRFQLLGERLSATADTTEFAQVITESAKGLFGADACIIMTLDDQTGEARVLSSKGVFNSTLVQECIRRGEPKFVPSPSPSSEGCTAVLPLRAEHVTMGALGLAFPSVQDLSEDQRQFLLFASRAFSHAMLRAKTKERALELQQVTTELSQALTWDEVIEVIQKRVFQSMGASGGVLTEAYAGGKELVALVSSGFSNDSVERWGRSDSELELPVPAAYRSGHPLFIGSREELIESFPLIHTAVNDTAIAAMAALPFTRSGQIIGAMGLAFRTPRVFTLEFKSYLTTLASQCAGALERAKLFEHLKSAQEQLELAVESSQLGIWDWHPKTGLLTWSDQLQRIFGLKPGEFLGTYESYQQLIHPEDRESAHQTIMAAIRSRKPYILIHRIVWPDGSVHWLQSSGRAFFDEKGELERMTGTSVIIDEKVKAEQGLKHAVQARDEFISIASHELKTPITSLRLQVEVLQRALHEKTAHLYSKENVFKLIKQTDRQLTQLTRLVDDMLDVSRIGAGRLSLKLEPVNVTTLVEELADRLSPQFAQAKIPFSIQSVGNTIVVADPYRLEQVIANLFTNAIRYASGAPLTIEVNGEVKGLEAGEVEVRIQDRGPGIPAADQERIFQRFERGQVGHAGGGLGLGLYISKTIIDAHRGWISLDSKVGSGATFIIHLPKT